MKQLSRESNRQWAIWAGKILQQAIGTKPTKLVEFTLPKSWAINLVLQDESEHPSGSLKHRLAASLISWGICNGEITPNSTLLDASSGSTAVSEAYYAKVLGLRFVAVVPAATSPGKLDLIRSFGGDCHLVAPKDSIYDVAAELGSQENWVYLDQFTNASLQTNWRCHNIASDLFDELAATARPVPDWVVVGAGTGGTATTIARYTRYRGLNTRLAVVDPEGSVNYQAWQRNCRTVTAVGSRIEGIGRPRVEPSYLPQLIDEVLPIPDRASIAAMTILSERGIPAGPSTGTNLIGALAIAHAMSQAGQSGTIASLLCDGAHRYQNTYCCPKWLAQHDLTPDPQLAELNQWLDGGAVPPWLPAVALD